MTKAEAHEFLSKCSHWWLWRKSIGEGEAIQRMKESCWVLISLSLTPLCVSLPKIINPEKASWYFFHVLALAFSFLATSLSIWLLVRVRQARLALRQSQITNPKS